jgi:hypothetical protein
MKLSQRILSVLVVVVTLSGVQPAFADVNVKVLTSKSYSGNKQLVYESGRTEMSANLWNAKVPTKIKIYRSEINVIPFNFKPLVGYSDIEDIRIEIALWSKAGKKITDSTLFDWNPTGGTTIEEVSFYNDGKVKSGSYFWLITTSSYSYEGKGELRVPLTITY